MEIIKKLKKTGAIIALHDPLADANEAENLTRSSFYQDPYLALTDSAAVIFVTQCPEFAKLNFKKMKSLMKKPFVFFDTRNGFYEREKEIKKARFLYVGIGR